MQVEARHAARPWIETLARIGYAAKGVLYVTIGGLAALFALGERGGRATDSHGALRALAEQPFGQVLLIAMTIGLGGHALWRLVQGTFDPEGEVRSAKRPLLTRLSLLGRGALHVLLVVFAVKLLVGEPTRSESTRSLSARVMSWEPYGVWLVAAAGVIIIGFGLAQLAKVADGEVGSELRLRRLSWSAERWVVRFGNFGTVARGVVLALVGGFVLVAAVQFDPAKAKGLGETLGWLRQQTFGEVLLGVVAFGLLAYGLYQFVVARFRIIKAT
jgi:hypothetical protein